MKLRIIFIQGTGTNEKNLESFFSLLKKRGYEVEFFPMEYDVPHEVSDVEPGSKVYVLKNKISNRLDELEKHGNEVIMIAHSFGGLILGAILNQKKYKNVKKVVTIASPNLLGVAPWRRLMPSKNKFLKHREDVRDHLGFTDISGSYDTYTIGFELDMLVSSKTTKLSHSKHTTLKADHYILFERSDSVQNKILNFARI